MTVPKPPTHGEAMHKKGASGSARAKRWLDATMRVKTSWTNDDDVAAQRLTFEWPGTGESASFDVGGILTGDPFENHVFLAEVKNYDNDDQGEEFDKFVALCLLVAWKHPRESGQFMYLTWHPFRVKTWSKLCTKSQILAAARANGKRLFGTETAADIESALASIDAVVDALAEHLWLLVLSQKQEQLIISDKDRAIIIANRVQEGLL